MGVFENSDDFISILVSIIIYIIYTVPPEIRLTAAGNRIFFSGSQNDFRHAGWVPKVRTDKSNRDFNRLTPLTSHIAPHHQPQVRAIQGLLALTAQEVRAIQGLLALTAQEVRASQGLLALTAQEVRASQD